MLGSLNAGASGVQSHGEAMTVTGSNIANANTTGFKTHRAAFADIFATSFGSTNSDFGQGSRIRDVTNVFTQGSFEGTSLSTDVALDGEGFLVVQNPENQQKMYTRAGDLKINDEGILTTQTGEKILVKDVDPVTKESIGLLKEINIMEKSDPPRPTGDGTQPGTGVRIEANLSSDSQVPEVPINLDNVQSDMYNFSTTVNVYDELGAQHPITVAFRKLPDSPVQVDAQGQITQAPRVNQWGWYALAPGESLENGSQGNMQAVGGGFLQFSEDGRYMHNIEGQIAQPPPAQIGQAPGPKQLQVLNGQPNDENPQVAFEFAEVDSPLLVGFNFGDGYAPNNPNDKRSGLDGLTQFSGKDKLKQINVDGNPGGVIESIEIDTDGVIQGIYDSGHMRGIGRVMIADFASPVGLGNLGNNLFKETTDSGQPMIGDPGIAGRAQIRSRNLEKSNVSLSKEFVDMIEYQRAFQANAKTITTSDEMLMDLVQLKR